MNLKRIMISLVVIVVLVGGGYWAYQQFLAPRTEETETNEPVSTSVATVNTVAIDIGVDVVSAEGQIVPLRDATLSFQTGGRVAEILVEEGAMVKAGDPLLRLEATDLEINLTQAEAALAQAEVALVQAEANLMAANASLLVAQEYVTTTGVGVTAAESQLALAQADPLPENIAVIESSIAVAEAGITQAAANRDVALSGITEAQIRAAEANVASADAQERSLQEQYDVIIRNGIGGPPEEQTRFALYAAELALIAAQTNLDLLNAGATVNEQRAANAAVSVAMAQRDAAQAELDLLLAGVKPEQVAVAEVGVTQAEATVSQAEVAVLQAEAAVTQAEAGIIQAEAGLAPAQASVAAAQAALDKMTLTAPFDGTIVDLLVELGETVTPSVPVMTLADFSGWLVETTDLTELDVVSVAVGHPVNVRVDAIPNNTLSGTVTDIAISPTLTRGDITYAVTIALDNTSDLPLRWGMTVFVDVGVGQ